MFSNPNDSRIKKVIFIFKQKKSSLRVKKNKLYDIFIYALQVNSATIKVVMALVKHDVPFAMTDVISPLMKNISDDSKIANSYTAAKTKRRAQ